MRFEISRIALGSLLALCFVCGIARADGSDPVAAAASEGQLEANGEITSDAFYGRPGSSIPIAVPGFRGLEPHLGITITSGTRNGFAGAGADLAGFSEIEAAAPNYGAPRYDGSEVYLRDGQPMVACASLPSAGLPMPSPSPSPSSAPSLPPSASCTHGGTHAMRTESYEKISFRDNAWYIWERSGIRLEYAPTFLVRANGATQTFRWGISRVVDLHGNSVHYTWACEDSPTSDCYPSQVTYYPTGATTATATINIYRQARTDIASFATGGATLGQTMKRLTTVEVRTGSQLSRAYAVSYLPDPATNRSLLSTVKIYGYDADGHINTTTGAVASGTTVPHPVTYTFDVPPSRLAADRALGTRAAAPESVMSMSWFADVNGDGRQDYVYIATGTVRIHALLAQVTAAPDGSAPVASFGADTEWGGRGYPAWSDWSTQRAAATATVTLGTPLAPALVAQWVTDVTGDGKADFVYLQNDGGTYKLWVKASTGSEFSAETATPWHTLSSAPKLNGTTPMAWLADVNGDGKSDLVYSTDGANIHTSLATGRSFSGEMATSASAHAGGKFSEAGWVWLVDVNGDGRSDWVYNKTGTLEIYYKLALIGTDGVFRFSADRLWGTRSSVTNSSSLVDAGCSGVSNPAGSDSNDGTWADLNGDGKVDFSYLVGSSHVQYTTYISEFCNGSPFTQCAYGFDDPCASHCVSHHVPEQSTCTCSYMWPCPSGTFAGTCWDDGLYPGNECYPYCYTSTIPAQDSCDCFGDVISSECYSTFTSSRKVMLSVGVASVPEVGWTAPNGGWLTDMNGDGMADHAVVGTGGALSVSLSSGHGLLTAASWGAGVTTGTGHELTEINGDGKPDLVYFVGNAIHSLQSTGAMVPVVSRVVSEIGGVTVVKYTPSSSWQNGSFVPTVPTLLSISVDDGRGVAGSVTRTSYSYTGGLYDFVNRRFLGFHTATKSLPCIGAQTTCPAEVTTFAQDYGSMSKPSLVVFWSGAAAGASPVMLRASQITYQTNGSTVPYVSLETMRTSTTYDPSGSGAHRLQRTTELCNGAPCYDAFGNLLQSYNYGFTDVGGDETASVFEYKPNANASTDPASTVYLVSALAHASTYDASGAHLLTDSYFYFDGSEDWHAPPTTGNLTKVASWLDTKSAFVVTRFGYDNYGNRTTVTDANGGVQTLVYDPTSTTLVVEARNPLYDPTTTLGQHQHVLTTWEPHCGAPLTQTDGNGQRVTMTYDKLCRVTQVNRPGGDGGAQSNQENRVYHMYDGSTVTTNTQNVYVTSNAPNGNGLLYAYRYIDGRGRTWQTRARGPGVLDIYTRTHFDARGNAISTTIPTFYAGGSSTFAGTGPTREFDDLGRVTKLTHLDGTYATWSYGPDSVTIVDELGGLVTGHRSLDTMNVRGQVVTHTAYDGATTEVSTYTYDARGNLSSIRDPAGNQTLSYADSLGRRYKIIDPDAGTLTTEFDNLGHVTLETDALGQQTHYVYDALGRPLSKTTYYGTPAASTVSWTYDERADATHANIGHRTSLVDASGTETQDFNVAGLAMTRTRTIGGHVYSFNYAYDAAGRLKGTRYPDGDIIGINPLSPTTGTGLGYDNAGQLTSMMAVPSVALLTSVAYDAQGNVITQTNPNGTITRHVFDASRGWLTSVTTVKGATTLLGLTYVRDNEGKITSLTSTAPNESWTYDYDPMHRLTTATNTDSPGDTQTFAYDAIGNMVSNSRVGDYEYNGGGNGCTPGTGALQPHAVTCAGGVAYGYDANGNMTSGPRGTFTYDGDHRVVTAGDTSYTYDANGERLTTTTGGLTTTTVGSGYEISSSGVTTKTLPFGVQRKSSGSTWNTFWLHVDGQSSTRVITDHTGAVTQRISYRPYGEVIAQSGAFDEALGYAGDRTDKNGLVFLHARYLDPRLGRFISPDPTVNDGLNRYTYTQNNPISFVDRSGFGSVFWGEFFRQLGQGAVNVGSGIVGGIIGLAQMSVGDPTALTLQMTVQTTTKIATSIAEGDSPTWATIDAVADNIPFYSGWVGGPINYLSGRDADGSDWQRGAGGALVNVAVMAFAPAPEVQIRTQSFDVAGPTRTLSADTPVFRTQPADMPLEPHSSPYFDPEMYNLPMKNQWESLYVSTDPEIAARHLDTPNYTMHESTLGDILADSGPGTMVFSDPKLPNSMVFVRDAASSSAFDWGSSFSWSSLGLGAASSSGGRYDFFSGNYDASDSSNDYGGEMGGGDGGDGGGGGD